MMNQDDRESQAMGKILTLLVIICALLFGISRCNAQSKSTVVYDTIPVINKNIESIYVMDKKQYMIYNFNGSKEAVSVSKSIVDYILLCRELNCSCKLAILRRQKDGVLSRVVKFNRLNNKISNNDNILTFKIYQK